MLQGPADAENFVPTSGADEEIPVSASNKDQEVPPVAISPVKSPLLVTSTSSQDSEATVTLTNTSQEQVGDLDLTDQEATPTYQTKEVQTEKCIS